MIPGQSSRFRVGAAGPAVAAAARQRKAAVSRPPLLTVVCCVLSILGAMALAPRAVAQSEHVETAPANAAPAVAGTDDGASPQPEPLYAAPTRADRSGRVQARVEINGHGPFRFIVDTGANRSALAPGIADQLGLPFVEGGVVEVHGVTGSAMLPAVRVGTLRAGALEISGTVLPVLSGNVFGGADGILGVAGIPDIRLDVDFANDRVVVGMSSGRRAPDGFLVVRGKLWQGGLLLVKGRVGKVPVMVILDTGAEKTMGNQPLRSALFGGRKQDGEFQADVYGATADIGSGTYFRAPMISIGSAKLLDLPVTFGDLYVFQLWGLTTQPALVVGMDVLGRLERFIVDYRRNEFQFKGAGVGAVVRRCTPSTCGSRIPESGT